MTIYRPSIIFAHLMTLVAIIVTLLQARENAKMIESNREFMEEMSPKVAEMWHMKEAGVTNRDVINNKLKPR